MTYKLFHYIGRSFTFSETAFGAWPSTAYEFVATVEAPALGAVFQLTNHIDAPWTDNPEIALAPKFAEALARHRAVDPGVNSSMATRLRSTSVGDIIVDEADGMAYGIAGIGLEPLGTVPVGWVAGL